MPIALKWNFNFVDWNNRVQHIEEMKRYKDLDPGTVQAQIDQIKAEIEHEHGADADFIFNNLSALAFQKTMNAPQ